MIVYILAYNRLERETRVTSIDFLLLYLYFALQISASSTPRINEALLFLVYSFILAYI